MIHSSNPVTSEHLVTDIVSDNYKTADVLQKYKIDFCCGGRLSLKMACEMKGLNEVSVLEELSECYNHFHDSSAWPVDFLIDYLVNILHPYIRKNLPVVQHYVGKFIASHGHKYPSLLDLQGIINDLQLNVISQINYESATLFPYIRRILYASVHHEVYGKYLIKTLHNISPLDLEKHHALSSKLMSQIGSVTNSFEVNDKMCQTQKVMLKKLHEFTDQLAEYISIEKKYLIPVTVKMEKELLELHV